VANVLIRLEQHMLLFEFRRLQMWGKKFRVGRGEKAEQKVLHNSAPD
jgi:hypothetical protein